jgi:small subunit ribosomal protein S3e
MSDDENQQQGPMPITKKRKFVADGVFNAELNEFLSRELGQDGYSGVEVRKTPVKVSIIIRATKTQNVLGTQGRRIRELTSLIHQRFFPRNDASYVKLYAERVQNRALCAVSQAETIRRKLAEGVTVRRACNGLLRYIMEGEAKGAEIIVAGKVRGQRAKATKFRDGYMIKSGFAAKHYVNTATRHVKLKQGMIGINVAIMLPYDPKGVSGCNIKQSDVVTVFDPPVYRTTAKKLETAAAPVDVAAPAAAPADTSEFDRTASLAY